MSRSLPTYRVAGSPEELGQGYGRQLAGLIQNVVPMRFAALASYVGDAGGSSAGASSDVQGVLEIGRQSYPIFERFDPEGFVEHEATARAAGVDPVELFTVGNMTDLRDAFILGGPGPSAASERPADAEGCSAILLPPSAVAAGAFLAGQTWDLNPEDVDYVIALLRRPSHGPATWTVTVAGCPTLVGMNELGLAVGTTNIKTWGSRPGVGYLNVLHKAIRCTTVEEAIEVVRTAPRAGAHTFWLADTGRAVELETTPDTVVLRDATEQPLIRTNHCLAPTVVQAEWQAPTSSSLARKRRLEGLMSTGAQSVASVRAAFGNREDGVDSVSRYREDGQGTATNAVIIAEPAQRRLHACRGPADRGDWAILDFRAER